MRTFQVKRFQRQVCCNNQDLPDCYPQLCSVYVYIDIYPYLKFSKSKSGLSSFHSKPVFKTCSTHYPGGSSSFWINSFFSYTVKPFPGDLRTLGYKKCFLDLNVHPWGSGCNAVSDSVVLGGAWDSAFVTGSRGMQLLHPQNTLWAAEIPVPVPSTQYPGPWPTQDSTVPAAGTGSQEYFEPRMIPWAAKVETTPFPPGA